ncbi:long-chain-fatty-acid--CoA ligase [Rhodococcoides fascians]|uniref:long-chain-fatty-acid--CoA ligase n=1 Tax=Rhodococcoides fascians TaxID=1828 RepID=UPI000564C076|nr:MULTISPECIES: long-chain fatty acid--CoA ligase [Rhodococcus]OZF01270.1 long-chain-fatty-acid--CoA ligase [Rhodococcus sp. 15-1189-1-1a]OZF15441.1 long-chain-fatty-acid--CoA ligase [Rhodococcus sp. 14-2686-1-2]
MTHLASLLESTTASRPDRTAVVFQNTRMSYSQLDDAANRVANLLVSRGIRPGDNVALSSPNLPHFTIVYFGILKAGAAVVPLNILLKPREIAYHLVDSQAKAYFAVEGTAALPIGTAAREGFDAAETCTDFFLITTDPGKTRSDAGTPLCAPAVAEQPRTFTTVHRSDDDTAVILYTSGTTGRPKGAQLTHRNMVSNALTMADLLDTGAGTPDVALCALPLFHSFGQTIVQNAGLARGITLVMMPRFDARAAIDLMIEERVTTFGGVPTMYWGLLQEIADDNEATALAAQLHTAIAGGSAMAGELHREFRERFSVTVLEGYGLSETSPTASFSRPGAEPRIGSVGRPIPGVAMKLIGDDWSDVPDDPDAIGEIAIKGPNVMKGYFNRPEASLAVMKDRWIRTGDLAKKDADGFYYIVDRSKDMIIRGGFNVYPREIEEVLMEHPAVSMVAVIGVPHESHGEEITAFVVKNKNHDEVTEAELVAWGKNEFAAYKYPRSVTFVDAFPTTSTGKILKRELRSA